MSWHNSSSSKPNRSVWIASAVGLVGGLLLSVPLTRIVQREGEVQMPAPLTRIVQPEGEVQMPALLPINPFESWSGFGGREVVVLGLDASGSNTDAIFTVRVEGERTSITQIPRDSYIDADDFGPLKINGLLARGGPDAVERELTRLMNRPIRHHILVNLDGIARLADLVGGIELDVPKRLYYVDRSQDLQIDLQPGKQVLRGKDLEGFLRWRNDGRGDFGRLERQQLALKALFERIKQPQHLIRLPELVAAAGRELQTDLNLMELGGLIRAMRGTDLNTQRLEARPFSRGGVSYLETEWPAKPSSGAEANEASSKRLRFMF
ncbi:LCP family protein [Synechococcus sp. MIT S1220]|uniref:LCP family protein n=1 Tax=Synechococcus sp. MIT S1220 TaxID=3082549 RepID=UPI0039B096D7